MQGLILKKREMSECSYTTDNSRYLIREAIRKIALGRGMERVAMAPGGMSGIGTARMVHGYVAKIHDDPSDEEFAEYGGTVDVGEYPPLRNLSSTRGCCSPPLQITKAVSCSSPRCSPT